MSWVRTAALAALLALFVRPVDAGVVWDVADAAASSSGDVPPPAPTAVCGTGTSRAVSGTR